MNFTTPIWLICVLQFLQVIDGKPTSNSGQASVFACIYDQNLSSYAEKIAILMTQNKAPVDDAKFNKFMGCYWKSKGLLNSNGDINADNLQVYLENIFADGGEVTEDLKQISRESVTRCKEFRTENGGKKAVMVQNCIMAYLMDMEAH